MLATPKACVGRCCFRRADWAPTVSYTPAPEEPPHPGDPKRPTTTRIAIWIGVAAVGLYFLGTGVYGIITGGN